MKSLIETITLYEIIQGLITLAVVAAWVFMLVTGQEPPESLFNVVMLVVGFFMNGVAENAVKKISK